MIPVSETELSYTLTQLDKHSEGPIFLQSNLRNYGLAGEAPNSVRLWRNADWSGFVGMTVAGMITPQMRDASDDDWRGLRNALKGIHVCGIIGEYQQATYVQKELGLDDTRKTLDHDEPAFDLDLRDLNIPEHDGLSLLPLATADEQLLLKWRIAYRIETIGDTRETAVGSASREVQEMLRTQSHQLLWRGETPVSLAGINAYIPKAVQVGGVYTPPEWRKNGYARRAVALLLEEKRQKGFTRAFLFAASDNAARAYTAIGFQPNGRVRMIFYRDKILLPHDPTRN